MADSSKGGREEKRGRGEGGGGGGKGQEKGNDKTHTELFNHRNPALVTISSILEICHRKRKVVCLSGMDYHCYYLI